MHPVTFPNKSRSPGNLEDFASAGRFAMLTLTPELGQGKPANYRDREDEYGNGGDGGNEAGGPSAGSVYE